MLFLLFLHFQIIQIIQIIISCYTGDVKLDCITYAKIRVRSPHKYHHSKNGLFAYISN